MSHLHRSMHRVLVRLEENPGNFRNTQKCVRDLRDILARMNDADARARIARKDIPWTDPSFQRRIAALLTAVANPESCPPAVKDAIPQRADEMLDEIQGFVPAAPANHMTLGMP